MFGEKKIGTKFVVEIRKIRAACSGKRLLEYRWEVSSLKSAALLIRRISSESFEKLIFQSFKNMGDILCIRMWFKRIEQLVIADNHGYISHLLSELVTLKQVRDCQDLLNEYFKKRSTTVESTSLTLYVYPNPSNARCMPYMMATWKIRPSRLNYSRRRGVVSLMALDGTAPGVWRRGRPANPGAPGDKDQYIKASRLVSITACPSAVLDYM
nr:hypothetical protein Iba_chr08dCG15400 [Ipomoea batatas]